MPNKDITVKDETDTTSGWKYYLKNRRFVSEFLFSLLILSAILFFYSRLLLFAESRSGAILYDYILDFLPVCNLTWVIFLLIYLSLISFLIYLSNKPELLLFSIQTYTLLIVVRMSAMFLMPLEPPQNMIPLQDPLVEYFGTGKLLTKDLFFSGHTATIFLFSLITKNKTLKFLFLFSAIIVAVSLLLQHVHYTIDVLAAPFFTYSVFVLVKEYNKRNTISRLF